MKTIKLSEEYFQGAVSLEWIDDSVQPWRIDYRERPLIHDGVIETAQENAGIKIGLKTTSKSFRLQVTANNKQLPDLFPTNYDLVVNNEIVETVTFKEGDTSVMFTKLPGADIPVEVWLNHNFSAKLGLYIEVDDDCRCEPYFPPKKSWLCYGSSITHSRRGHSPAQTWPGIVARQTNLANINLGYAGQCMMEPLVAKQISEQRFDYISLCLGINCYGGGVYSPRSFQQMALGFISRIREHHPDTPLLLVSPIYSPGRETKKTNGLSLQDMRHELETGVALWQQHMNDQNIHYLSGLEIFGKNSVHLMPDDLHPDGDGMYVMADNFMRKALQLMGVKKIS
jgi:lysophospholipase L1-like esterase